jgi:hypothetical protein
MIDFKDFVPERVANRGFFKDLFQGPVYESFEAALAAANSWIQSESIQVRTIETVVLPNIWSEEGSTDVDLKTVSGSARWHQFIRIWYERA